MDINEVMHDPSQFEIKSLEELNLRVLDET